MLKIRNLFLLFSLLVIAFNYSFSQTIYNDSLVLITKTQLKKTNLIFIDHDKLTQENKILADEIFHFRELVKNYQNRENEYRNLVSNLKGQISSVNEDLLVANELIAKKEKRLKRTKNWLLGSGIVCVGLLTWLVVN